MGLEAAIQKELLHEQDLIEKAQAGDLEAMRPLLEKYSDPLYSTVILPRLGNPTLAEDVLRDTLTTAIEKLSSFRWTGKSIYGWLRQIAINKTCDLYRKHKRQHKLAEALSRQLETDTPAITRPDLLLMAAQEQQQHRQSIHDTLALLNLRYRQAIELRLVQKLSREQCAQMLAVSVPTFDVLLHRAVRAFRKQFTGGQRP